MLRSVNLRISHGGVLAAFIAIPLLTGCTTGTPDAIAVPSPSETAESNSAVPTPESTPVAQAIDCEAVLTEEAMAKLSTDGLEPIEPNLFDPLAMQMQEAGGLACSWGKPSTDIVLTVVQVAFDPADESTWLTALEESDYVSTDEPVTGAFTGPVEAGSGLSPVAVLTVGTLTYVSAPTFAEWIAPTR